MSQDAAAAPAAPAPVEPVVAEEGHKVFVGNLSFQTTKEELAEHFSKPHPVLKADIITRNVRSLGYGFVAFETLAQAEEAVKNFDKSELGGRTINVEVAKPKVEHPPREPKQKKKNKKAKAAAANATTAAEGENKDDANAANADASADADKEAKSEGSAEEGKKKGKRSNRSRRKAKAKANANANAEAKEGDEAAAAATPAPNGESAAPATSEGEKESTGKRRKRRNKAANGGDHQQSTGAERAPRVQGPPSKTGVFVANLPFNMKDDGLKELFSEYKVASARVVVQRYSGRSRGYGFVEFADEAEQQKVLSKMKTITVNGREVSVSIAHSEVSADSGAGAGVTAAAAPAANDQANGTK
ncbi:hypothetical protein BGW41_006942 [Actinomortierella wolfii]|nr:hypothetical protein BGW41_006942 [Actinomortierella wolfii]